HRPAGAGARRRADPAGGRAAAGALAGAGDPLRRAGQDLRTAAPKDENRISGIIGSMFNLGMGELLVILVLALLFLGPKKLPEVATQLGKAIRGFRKATHDLTDSLEVDDSVRQPLRELKAALRDEPAPQLLAMQPPPKNTVDVKPAEAPKPSLPAKK